MADRGFAAAAVHGDLGQGAREQALRAFRSGKIDVLVATDVAARGIDVQDVTHVINYQCPDEERTFLHRIGRTGRAGAKGVAVTFVDWDDIPKWGLINKALELPFVDVPETYSSSPHLYADLDIPEGTTGRLPRSSRTREGARRRAARGRRRDRPAPQGPVHLPRRSGRSGRSRPGRGARPAEAFPGHPGAAPAGAARPSRPWRERAGPRPRATPRATGTGRVVAVDGAGEDAARPAPPGAPRADRGSRTVRAPPMHRAW